MTRILHTADWHLGAPNAHPVFLSKTVPTIIKAAKKYSCDYILIVGDVFDKPKPDQRIKDLLSKQLLNANNEVTFIFTVGNHDYTNKLLEYHSLKNISILKDASGNRLKVHVLEPGETIKFEDVSFKALKDLQDGDVPNAKTPMILAWHGTPPGIKFIGGKINVEENAAIQSVIKKYKPAYFALGDLHRPIKLAEKCYYSGPPVQKTYADKDGIIIYDTETEEVEKYRLPLPKKETINVASDSSIISDQSLIELAKNNAKEGNLVKIKCSVPVATWTALDQAHIKEELKKHFLDVILENDPIIISRSRKSIEQVSKAKTMEDELEIILEEEDLKLNRDKLRSLCKKYLSE